MMQLEHPEIIELSDILEHERDLLRSGRASEAALLIERKMAALQAFEAAFGRGNAISISSQSRRAVHWIIQLAEENAIHMTAIQNGIRHALARLERINDSTQVGSYGRDGLQLSFKNATGAFNRRV